MPADHRRAPRDERALLRLPGARARARRAHRHADPLRRTQEVGADRIANAVGAYDLYGGPTIVVDFGTANTVDAVSEKGEYLGGAIFPGIEISLDALFERAAMLRRVELVAPKNVIGKSTIEAIQSGAVYGYSGQVDGARRPLRRPSSGRARWSPPAASPS